VAGEKLTLHSRPASDEIATGYFVTNDGFEAHDTTIIQNGVLRTYLLDLYGANKTGHARAETGGGCFVIEPGDSSYDEMVSHIDEGILITRFSGGVPSPKGDFSGVAKNSYYISGGQIRQPVSETMIAGNLVDMWNSIEEISRERVDFGTQIMPWIRMSGVSVS
ncbi:MAG: metallopeptidase TldD-related protein, partial [Gammaproteobacteria bacterium]|nr:metallopeptidase TldD-related protein [Gammaproteobacteria bacterium]